MNYNNKLSHKSYLPIIFVGFIFIILFMTCQLTKANPIKNTYQSPFIKIENGFITADIQNIPIQEILRDISSKTDIDIYISKDIDNLISVKFDVLPLEEGLKRIFRPLDHAMVFTKSPEFPHEDKFVLKKVKVVKKGHKKDLILISPIKDEQPVKISKKVSHHQKRLEQSSEPNLMSKEGWIRKENAKVAKEGHIWAKGDVAVEIEEEKAEAEHRAEETYEIKEQKTEEKQAVQERKEIIEILIAKAGGEEKLSKAERAEIIEEAKMSRLFDRLDQKEIEEMKENIADRDEVEEQKAEAKRVEYWFKRQDEEAERLADLGDKEQ